MIKKTKLGDISDLSIGFVGTVTTQYEDGGIPFFRTLNIKPYKIVDTDLKRITKEFHAKQKKSQLRTGDVAMVHTGVPGICCVIPKEYDNSNCIDMIVIKPHKEELDSYFLEGYMNIIGYKHIEKQQVGCIQKHFNLKDAQDLMIYLPDIMIQRKIGELNHTINKIIQINDKIIAELEAMAKTIYDYWFLQFEFPNEDGKPYKSSGGKMVWNEELKREIPEEWRNGTLEDLGEIIAGGTPSTNHPEYYSENGIAWITPNDLSNSNDKYITHGERDISEIGLNNSSARLMPKGTVLLTSRAPIGYLGIAANEVCTNQGFKSIVPNEKFGSEFIYHTVENMIVYLKSLGTGSTFTEISKTVVASVKIAIPEESVVRKFEEMVSGICAKHRIIERENKELISLRDFLLPLLMNGQVGFKN